MEWLIGFDAPETVGKSWFLSLPKYHALLGHG